LLRVSDTDFKESVLIRIFLIWEEMWVNIR